MNPETIAGYRVHPAANLFPMMDEPELQALADDIKKNGQHEPIIYVLSATGKGRTTNPKEPHPDDILILDGRNRLRACEMRSGQTWFQWLDSTTESDPITYVLSKNLHRRHLTAEQRAAIVLQAEELSGALAKIREEAKAREVAGTLASREARVRSYGVVAAPLKKGERSQPSASLVRGMQAVGADLLLSKTTGKTAAVIAEKAKVSRATVERVQAATKDNPDALDAIAKGKTTSAKVKASKPKPEPAPAPASTSGVKFYQVSLAFLGDGGEVEDATPTLEVRTGRMTAARFYDDRFRRWLEQSTNGRLHDGSRYWHPTPADAWAAWRKEAVEQLRTHEVMVKALRESLAKGDAIMKGAMAEPAS